MQATTLDTDVFIVGSGPAGATLARALPSPFRVILLDKRPLESPPVQADKPCGGLLAPDAQAQLFHMQLALPHEVLVHPQIFGVRAIDFETGVERTFHRHYINIHRALFDRWLFSLAVERPNITALAGRRLERYLQHPDGIEAFLDDGTVIRAKIIVGADGATSKVRTGFGNNPFDATHTQEFHVSEKSRSFADKCSLSGFYAPRKSLALQTWFAVEKAPAEYGAFFHRSISDFYSWTIPKGDALIVGTIVPWGTGTKRGAEGLLPRERMQLLCESIQKHGYTLGEELRTESCAVLTPGLFTPFQLGQGRAFLIGEAAGLVSPSSFEGVSYAFRSALALASVLRDRNFTESTNNAGSKGVPALEEYRKKLLPLTARLRLKWIKGTVIYHPALRNLALSLKF